MISEKTICTSLLSLIVVAAAKTAVCESLDEQFSRCFESLSLAEDGTLNVEMLRWGAPFAGGMHESDALGNERVIEMGERFVLRQGCRLDAFHPGLRFRLEFVSSNSMDSVNRFYGKADGLANALLWEMNGSERFVVVPAAQTAFNLKDGLKFEFKFPFANKWKSGEEYRLNVDISSRSRASEIERSRARLAFESLRCNMNGEGVNETVLTEAVPYKDVEVMNAQGKSEYWTVELERCKAGVIILGLGKIQLHGGMKSAEMFRLDKSGKIRNHLSIIMLGQKEWYGTFWRLDEIGNPVEFAEWREGGKVFAKNGVWRESESHRSLRKYFEDIYADFSALLRQSLHDAKKHCNKQNDKINGQ